MFIANVFHQQDRNKMFFAKPAEYNPVDYKLVAVVSSDDHFSDAEDFLEYVYEKTNSIFQYWGLNKGVNDVGGENRSTSVGDVIQYKGSLYMVSSFGFEKLTDENCSYIDYVIRNDDQVKLPLVPA